MDSFVEAQKDIKTHELSGGASLCIKRKKPRSSLLVRTCISRGHRA